MSRRSSNWSAAIPLRSFTVQTADAAPLPDALLRDALGWPLAVTGAAGSVDLPADAAEAAELWIETASGAVYDLEWRSGELVVAHAASELRVGAAVLHDESVDEVTPVAPVSEIRYWRDSKRPWPEIDARVATPLQRSIDGSYGAHLLAGEALWFEARGRGYDYCAVEDLGPGRSAFGEEPLPCPLLPPGRSVGRRSSDRRGWRSGGGRGDLP